MATSTIGAVERSDSTTAAPPPDRPARWWRRLPDPVVCAVVIAIAAFAVLGIGSPLWGRTSLVETGLLNHVSPYTDTQFRGIGQQTLDLGDTVDSAIPSAGLFGDAIRDGEYPSWNPYVLGGTPLGGTPNPGLASPVALPFWFLPAWLAPAFVKLLEIIVAVGGAYLFLRLLRLGRAAALLGGLAYATSAFMVVWTNWPQSRVAAFIPALFWALERIVRHRRVRDLALLALVVAALLLGGFPSVTGYALLTGACYVAVRAAAENPGAFRRIAGTLCLAAGGVLAGVALVAAQLVPWASVMSTVLVRGREQTADLHIPFELLLTTVAPYAFGTTDPANPPNYYHVRIFLEEVSYVGAAVLVLAVVAVALARSGRAVLPRATWAFFVAATLLWGVVIYSGGPLLALLQKLPYLFSDNSVERARSILGFLVAVLAAAGFEVLLRRRREATSPARKLYAVAVWAVVAAGGAAAYLIGRDFANTAAQHRVSFLGGHYVAKLNAEMLQGLAFVAVALACALLLWWGPRHATFRVAVAALIPVLVAVQALIWVRPYYPRTERENFYPVTGVHTYLAQHLDHERWFGSNNALFGGIHTQHRLRALHGHSFVDERFGELLEAMPGRQFSPPPKPATYLRTEPLDGAPPTSPILDLLSVTHYVTPPERVPFGPQRVDAGDGSSASLRPGQTVSVAVPGGGPLRAVAVTPVTDGISQTRRTRIGIVLKDGAGAVVAEAERYDRGIAAGKPFYVPLAAEAARGPLTAEITLRDGPALAVAGRAGKPALSVVAPADDGLRLVYDDAAVIYERTRALPRVRWASRATVEPSAERRLERLAAGTVAPDEVLLDRAGPAAAGAPAEVRWVQDGFDDMEVAVDAAGAGYVVLADAIQPTWQVTVDGKRADLVRADHGLAAVAVPAGEHTVRFSYAPRGHDLGRWVTVLAIAGLLLAVLGEWWWLRRRRPAIPAPRLAQRESSD
ncbi:YfhO family protein [Phytohabitans sp. ZYX-F-186]|uniref:YfhO family protein n=1 Tax=Phytohabitans maris TaxID=3071409 RepID=A0ABU0ZVF4_9ACTN|nr:YfhO family protein [Phytohabitans sp. ZYX-F-186]MDQ7911021.1 YfhO family protein [Phytohabitans sp. ZYX-F-186]